MATTNGTPPTKRLVIIDNDGGTDDCHGILIAAADPGTEIIALTCVFGNVSVEQASQNVLRTVHVSDKLRNARCPIYVGASKPLAGRPFRHFNVHGEDGLGNSDPTEDLEHYLIDSEPACLALLRLVNQRPGEITIAAIGPLTNLALASRIDPTFSSKIKELVIMGGDSQGVGNITACAEFNFNADPEAARVVLEEFECPKTLVSWEMTMKVAWDMDWMDNELFSKESKSSKFLRHSHEHIMELSRKDPGRCTGGLVDLFPPCDQAALAIVANPALITASESLRCTVEVEGTYGRGHLVIDRHGVEPSLEGVTPTRIVTEMNMEEFKQMTLKSVQE